MLSPDSHHEIKSLTPPAQLDLEQIADVFISQIRNGEKPVISEYVKRYPDHASEIKEFFPAIAALEGGKQAGQAHGKVSLGASTPQQLGDFKIVREIGRGGMGVVYEAIQESLNRRVALKLLPRHSLLEENQLRRFRREAELTASLHHTNIVPVFGVGENSGFHYYVMQLIEGVGLDELTQKIMLTAADSNLEQITAGNESLTQTGSDTSLSNNEDSQIEFPKESTPCDEVSPEFEKYVGSPQNIAALGIQAANALQYAHDRGILHRDIKPGNLLLDRDGLLCITDFGLARAAEQTDLSKSTDMVGTLGYMAPEMFRGETCRQSDIYGLGITLYELLTKRPAIDRTSRHEMIDQITRGTIPSLRRVNPELPRDLETIIQKAVAADTKHRYLKASDLADDLNRFLENRPISARRVTLFEHLWRWSRRNPAIASLSGLALSLLLLLGITMAVGFENERRERKRAEASSQLATAALDRVFNRFVPSRAPSTKNNSSAADYSEPVLSRESADLLAGMVQFYEQLADSTGSQREFQIKAANAQHKVGDIHRRLGDYQSALAAYQKSLAIYNQNSDEADPLTVATLFNEIGRIHWYLNQLTAANASYQKAEKLLKQELANNPEQPALRFELARSYFLMSHRIRPGQVKRHPNPPQAPRFPATEDESGADQTLSQKAIEILEPLVSSDHSKPEYRYLLALCLQEQISNQYPQSQADTEKQARVLQILENLVQEYPHVADYRQAVVKSYERIEFRYTTPQDIEETVTKLLQKAIQHASRLVSDYPTIPEYKISLIHAHHKLAHALNILTRGNTTTNEIRDRHDTAELSMRTAIRLQRELANQFPEAPEHQQWLAKLELDLAKILERKGSDAEAILLHEDSIKILETELKTQSDSPNIYVDLLDATQALSRLYQRSEDELNSILMWDKHNQYEAEFEARYPGEMRRRSNKGRTPQRGDGPPPRDDKPRPPRERNGPPFRR
ncbi:serine/threonine-protein kinase [uncultured Gimesia sp.]|uniref:serine/threonine-protein kinase n=1 Tax=uncultured Gimesia sp. TaxID=1678688 RepID=UPI0030DBECF5|tara:strand:- start:134708 stop:137620 length:2913 start_codon:yes stop_codon:yes gene_type:complete